MTNGTTIQGFQVYYLNMYVHMYLFQLSLLHAVSQYPSKTKTLDTINYIYIYKRDNIKLFAPRKSVKQIDQSRKSR